MIRYPLFDTPHKALRLAFSQLLTEAGKTDFSQMTDVTALENQMATVFSLVKSHSYHEDAICFAALDLIAPNATQHDRAEHVRLHETLDELLLKVAQIAQNVKAGQAQTVAGNALYTDLCNLHSDMLIHLLEEELDTQPVFWQHMTDEQLGAFEPQIMGSMTPEMSALWLRYIIPTQPMNAVIEMFKGMEANAPSFVFDANMGLAKDVLSAAEFAKLEGAFKAMVTI
jgi:Hemerythrin HHE cation binding domain